MSTHLVKVLEELKLLPEITIGKIIEQAQGEALLVLCLISILPFLQPIPIPGLSSMLGFIVLLQGIGLMFWSKPLVTKKMKEIIISHEKFEYVYHAGLKLSLITSKFSSFKHPITKTRISHFLCGFALVVSSAFLSLPLPIPFSNLIPAISIFLICVGLLEEDIVLILIGHGTTLTVIWMAVFSYNILADQFKAWF
jgi:hypothetical protein